jgi:hypothetical protein
METMTVKELIEALQKIPNEYHVRSRAKNAHLDNDEMPWQLGFADVITKVKKVDSQQTVMLIRGFE